jgi:hypothetical protein
MTELEQAIAALRAGKREEGRKLLAAVLRQDKDNLRAWQWMYNAAESDREKKYCLKEILRINPQNQKAAQMLAQMDGLTVGTKSTIPGNTTKKTPPKKNNLILGIILGSLLLFVCCCSIFFWSRPDQSIKSDNYIDEYGGSQQVYEKIESLTSCAELQAQFDQASQNNALHEPGSKNALATTGYMVAADQRMKELGCYEQQPVQPPEVLLASTATKQPEFTATAIPSLTAMPQPTRRATLTAEATLTALPSLTPLIPKSPPGSAVCSCAGDTYNCPDDFQTQSSAQACFNYCVAQGVGDIHRLDANNDGVACENLP